MIFCDLFALIGVILTLIASYTPIIIGRIMIGITLGIGSTVVPLYTDEMSPDSIKGMTGSLSVTQVSAGILVGYGMGFLVPSDSEEPSYAWRVALGF